MQHTWKTMTMQLVSSYPLGPLVHHAYQLGRSVGGAKWVQELQNSLGSATPNMTVFLMKLRSSRVGDSLKKVTDWWEPPLASDHSRVWLSKPTFCEHICPFQRCHWILSLRTPNGLSPCLGASCRFRVWVTGDQLLNDWNTELSLFDCVSCHFLLAFMSH